MADPGRLDFAVAFDDTRRAGQNGTIVTTPLAKNQRAGIAWRAADFPGREIFSTA